MPDLRVSFPNPCGEKWEAMTAAGCHRTCDKCDKLIHDLSQYDVTQVEKLLRDEPDSCVRASIDAFGRIATKPERHGNIRRMVAVAGASAGLLISQPALAENQRIDGVITGTTQRMGYRTKVIAKDENGNSYRAKVKSNGRYKINRVPPGVYSLEFFSSDCGTWTIQNVVVAPRASTAADEPENDAYCIVVGSLKIDDYEG